MKTNRFRLPDGLAVNAGLLLLLIAGLLAAFLPVPEFSEHERRYLADAPAAPSLTDWKTDRQVESYLSDRLPLRRWLVGADAAVHVLTGRRTQLESWPVGDAFLEKPVSGDTAQVERRLAQMAEVAEKAGADFTLITPPTHGYLLRESLPRPMRSLYEAEGGCYAALNAHEAYLPLEEAFAAFPDSVYYRTDHHWTLQGAYLAYEAYCSRAGLEPLPLEGFQLTGYDGFLGTTYSRSGLPSARPETLLCAQPYAPVALNILDDGSRHTSLIFPEKAATYDGYAVYMGGNYGLAEVINPEAPEGTLLVYKDSFANCLLPIFSAHYRRIVVMDARYASGSFSDAIAHAGQVDHVLFVYSLDSLLNDTVVARKIVR